MNAKLIADLCDPIARQTDDFVAAIAADVTPFDLLDWYRCDMETAQCEAFSEMLDADLLKFRLRYGNYPPLALTDGAQAGKRPLCVHGIVDELGARQYA